jgi:hypothetical protein
MRQCSEVSESCERRCARWWHDTACLEKITVVIGAALFFCREIASRRERWRLLRRFDPLLPLRRGAPQHRRQKLPGVTPLRLHNIFRRAAGDDLAAAVAAFGP